MRIDFRDDEYCEVSGEQTKENHDYQDEYLICTAEFICPCKVWPQSEGLHAYR